MAWDRRPLMDQFMLRQHKNGMARPASTTADDAKLPVRIGRATNFSPNVLVLERALQPTLFVTVFRLKAGGMDMHRLSLERSFAIIRRPGRLPTGARTRASALS